VPILISELERDGPAAKCGSLYVGDAILSANGQDLKQVIAVIRLFWDQTFQHIAMFVAVQ
jgi:C-terminal processing protease CtpA/Prc